MHDTFLSFLLNLYPFSATKLFHVTVVLFSRHLDGSHEQVEEYVGGVCAELPVFVPSVEYLLVVIDYYSRFPEVEIVRSITSATIINKLRKIFAVHGICNELVSDNGSQFVSEEFKMLKTHNIITVQSVLNRTHTS
jgi:hypothetical protein